MVSYKEIGITLYGLAWLTNIGWFYVADSLALAVLLVNLLLPSFNVRGLSVRRRLRGRRRGRHLEIFEDDVVAVEVHLSNRSIVPKFVLNLRDDCPLAAPGAESQGYVIGALEPRGRVTASYEVTCHRRGVYGFGPIQVQSSAPFGLFRSRRLLDASLEVTVYPKALPMDAEYSQGAHQRDAASTSRPGLSGEFRGSREFHYTDHLRDIHWRNSARRGQLMVREFDQTPRGEVRLGINPGVELGSGRETTLEYAIKIAASLARRSFQDGRPFRMWPSGKEANRTTWRGVLEHLARIQGGPGSSVREMLGQSGLRGMSVIVVSAADEDNIAVLRTLRSFGGHVTIVLLQGFSPIEDKKVAEKLSSSGFHVVPCRIHGLPEALVSLSRALEATATVLGSPPSAPAPTRP